MPIARQPVCLPVCHGGLAASTQHGADPMAATQSSASTRIQQQPEGIQDDTSRISLEGQETNRPHR